MITTTTTRNKNITVKAMFVSWVVVVVVNSNALNEPLAPLLYATSIRESTVQVKKNNSRKIVEKEENKTKYFQALRNENPQHKLWKERIEWAASLKNKSTYYFFGRQWKKERKKLGA